MQKQRKKTANTLAMMRICLDDGKWITETAPAAVIYLTAGPWPVPDGAASCWGLDPHLWTQLFPALLGTARSVQLSAQGQLMRCKYVKLCPLSQGSCKQWSHTDKTWSYDEQFCQDDKRTSPDPCRTHWLQAGDLTSCMGCCMQQCKEE